MKDQAIGPFDLAIAPGVHHEGIVDVDAVFLAVVPELGAREQSTQVCDDPVRHSELVRYLLDELGCIGCCSGCHWLDFDPIYELVDRHEYVVVSAFGRL